MIVSDWQRQLDQAKQDSVAGGAGPDASASSTTYGKLIEAGPPTADFNYMPFIGFEFVIFAYWFGLAGALCCDDIEVPNPRRVSA